MLSGVIRQSTKTAFDCNRLPSFAIIAIMHAAIYIRKSREDLKRKNRDSKAVSHRLALQREQLPAHAKAQGWTYEIYDDGYASAARGKHEDLKERARLERDIRAGKIDVILCIELERLSRDDTAQDYFAWLALCRDNGVKLSTLAQLVDPTQTNDWVLTGLTGILSSAEMQKMKIRMQEGYRKAFRSGKWLGGTPPLPYVYDYPNSKPVIDKNELPKMQQLWDLARVKSARAVAIDLGYPEIFVRRALSDERLAIYQAKRIDPIDGSTIVCDWEPCMTEELAAQIQAARRHRRNLSGLKNTYASLLSALGVLRCGYCGATAKTWQGKVKNDGTRVDYYGCQKKNGKTCVQSTMVKQAVLNRLVTENLLNTLGNIDELKTFWLQSKNPDDYEAQLQELLKAEKSEETKKRRLISAISEGHIDFADIKPEMAKISGRIGDIRSQREELQKLQIEMPDLDSLAITHEEWEHLDMNDHRVLINAAIETITLYNSYAIIAYRFPRSAKGDCTSRINLPPQEKPKRK